MKLLSLNYGPPSKVDDDVHAWASRWKWSYDRGYASRRKYVQTIYTDGVSKQKYTKLYLHREIMATKSGEQVDHINGDGLDNRRKNLRICTQRQNTFNRRKQTNCRSGFKGVYWHKKAKKWASEVRADGTKYYLGLFESPIDAALAYNQAAQKYHGKFARLNKV